MCRISKDSLISCQLSFYPLGTIDYYAEIQHVLAIIQQSDLSYTVNDMSTQIIGSAEKIYMLLHFITQRMDDQDCEFTMTATLSNTCGITKEKI